MAYKRTDYKTKSTQDGRINKAHGRARDILKFSPLVTDAYFHYTPSQIMLASLSLADHGLFERMIDEIFPPSAGKVLLVGQAVREKTVATVLACKDMLLEEPPERMTEFWGTVCAPSQRDWASY